jgi:hypothetical protein
MELLRPVAMVCRVLGAPRSTVYARRQSKAPARPGPATSISDYDLLELIRQVLVASPFAGEGYRKIRARLHREHGVRVSGKRVLRLLRQEGLLAPQRVRRMLATAVIGQSGGPSPTTRARIAQAGPIGRHLHWPVHLPLPLINRCARLLAVEDTGCSVSARLPSPVRCAGAVEWVHGAGPKEVR